MYSKNRMYFKKYWIVCLSLEYILFVIKRQRLHSRWCSMRFVHWTQCCHQDHLSFVKTIFTQMQKLSLGNVQIQNWQVFVKSKWSSYNQGEKFEVAQHSDWKKFQSDVKLSGCVRKYNIDCADFLSRSSIPQILVIPILAAGDGLMVLMILIDNNGDLYHNDDDHQWW